MTKPKTLDPGTPPKQPRKRKPKGLKIFIPKPSECRRPNATRGIEVTLCDGNVWELPRGGLWKILREVRDRIYVTITLRGQAEHLQLRAGCYRLLLANYDLTQEQVSALVLGTHPSHYSDAVVECVLPTSPARRGFTDWAQSALIANGLKPGDISPDLMPYVLDQLVLTGRAVDPDEYTEAGIAAGKRACLPGLGDIPQSQSKAITQETE